MKPFFFHLFIYLKIKASLFNITWQCLTSISGTQLLWMRLELPSLPQALWLWCCNWAGWAGEPELVWNLRAHSGLWNSAPKPDPGKWLGKRSQFTLKSVSFVSLSILSFIPQYLSCHRTWLWVRPTLPSLALQCQTFAHSTAALSLAPSNN